MFKKLLSGLTGQKDKSQAPVEPEQAHPVEAQPPQEERIVAYDANGREMHITRSDWREKVFLPGLEQKWDDPAELYDAILAGLNDGFATDLLPAAARLVAIDDNPERSHTLQGIVLMQNNLHDEAEATLNAGIDKAGPTGTLLTNLAKVYAERGDSARADALLWQAIKADPNQDNGLLWWASLKEEREGTAGYVAGLKTVAALPGAWRAQLWLARHYLEQKNVAAAKTLYDEVLAGGRYDGSSLMMISGDLGRNGEIPLLVDLIAPVYDEHRHDPMAGMNLLRAYQELGNPDAGERLLSRMYALEYPPLKQHLDAFAQAFQQMREQGAQGVPTDPAQVEISTLALSQPIWHYGLYKADWLFGQKPEEADIVGFFALSKITDETKPAESQREDDVGRLTRAIPLYLAEAAHYWTPFAARCYFQVAAGLGPVLSTHETDGNELFDLVPPSMKYFVTGQLGCEGEGDQRQWQLTLSLWDCRLREKCAVESATVPQAELGAWVLELEQRLLAKMGGPVTQALDAFYTRPSAEAMNIYLAELGQAFTLTMVANNYVPRAALWGERSMLEWPLNMALQWPQAEVPKLMYLSGLSKACDYQSEVLAEYKKRTLALLESASGTPCEKLAPLVWKIFGMQEELNAYREALPAETRADYAAWLGRITE
ncbi:tetratricopeptide repeat protein [Yokenella regensburgei]|uniref:tetratricopeptide repeat protein n=1 Tax=Yokenella regensburgei TaxID=158877 RepID=UPI003F168A35